MTIESLIVKLQDMAAEHPGAEVYLFQNGPNYAAPMPFYDVSWSQEHQAVVLGQDCD